MDGFYSMRMKMYKPKEVNVEKLKQYLKKQEKDGKYNKLGDKL
jgi:hypothetical protein